MTPSPSLGAGGLDYFMAGTCFVFLVIGPILRPLTQLWLMWVPMSIEAQKVLHQLSRHISIFYAFEVLLNLCIAFSFSVLSMPEVKT